MNAAGAFAFEGVVLLLGLALMRLALGRRRQGGLFTALPLGLAPVLLITGMAFNELHRPDSPGMVELRGEWNQRWERSLDRAFPRPDQAPLKEEARPLGGRLFATVPALFFCLNASLLAALAIFLRRRQTRLGLMAPPEPLSRWTAPFWLVWLVLGPVFWILAREKGLIQASPRSMHLAGNVLFAGLVLYLFQGAVILGAKLLAWSRHPSTRALTPLVLVGVVLSLLILNGQGLLVFLVLTGLFDPWIDLRRLRPPKPDDAGSES